MKNVFLIPTNKKSRLHVAYNAPSDYDPHNKSLNVDRPKLVLYDTPKGSGKNIFAKNIYITNDEYLKIGREDLGCYYLNSSGNITQKKNSSWENRFNNEFSKKIVLTTDQDLISDGVQEVSSSFLDFYVVNPTDCVEVTKMLQTRHGCDWYDLPNQKEDREMDGIYRYNYRLNFAEKSKTQEESLEVNKQFIENTPSEKLEDLMKEFDNYEIETLEAPH